MLWLYMVEHGGYTRNEEINAGFCTFGCGHNILWLAFEVVAEKTPPWPMTLLFLGAE
jgi:hypothetical protein